MRSLRALELCFYIDLGELYGISASVKVNANYQLNKLFFFSPKPGAVCVNGHFAMKNARMVLHIKESAQFWLHALLVKKIVRMKKVIGPFHVVNLTLNRRTQLLLPPTLNMAFRSFEP